MKPRRRGRDVAARAKASRPAKRTIARRGRADFQQTREALLESEKRFQSAFEYAAIGMTLVGPDGKFLKVNRALCEMLGYQESELLSKTFQEITHPEDLEEDCDYVRRMLAGEIRTYQMEKRYFRKDGRTVHVLLSVSLLRDSTGEPVHFISQIQDIHSRKEAERALRESEARFRALIEEAPIAIAVNRDEKRIYVNQAWRRLFRIPEGWEVRGQPVLENWAPEWKDLIADYARRRAAGAPTPLEYEGVCRRHDGTQFPAWIAARWLRLADGPATISFFRDLTKRKEAEKTIVEERERLMAILRGIGDAVIATDRDRRVIFLNPVAETLTGWRQEEAVGRSLPEVFRIAREKTGEACESLLDRALANGGSAAQSDPVILFARDGARRLIEDHAAPIRDREGRILGGILVFRDVTERRRMQEEMLRAHRLKSLGFLAGGIAHDFNNILTVIMGNTSLALAASALDERFRKYLEESEKACLRAKDLTDQLLTFSKGGAPVRKAAFLPDLVRESVKFALRGSSVGFRDEFPPDLWAAEVDVGQIARVFNNLALNSVQAMPNGGRITVSGQNIACESEVAPPAKKGRWIEVLFHDNGIGIPSEQIGSIFDPFFSTKSQGSGLGLAICHSIITRHGGRLFAESEPGKGTTIHLLLPAAEQPPSEAPPTPSAPVALRGRILVMDDEEGIRFAAKTMFLALGCETECAEDGAQAVALYREALDHGTPFRAVLMDLTVPGGMGGREAAREMLAVDPDVRIIASSGYSTDPVMIEPQRYGFRAVLAKPYTVADLARVCASVFDA